MSRDSVVAGEEAGGLAEAEAPARTGMPRYSRRLSDKVLVAFHHACDLHEFEAAEQLLAILESMLRRRPSEANQNRRRNMESLVAAHERLWQLRHQQQPEM